MVRAEARLLLPDLAATRTLARRIADRLLPGSVVLLQGDLGAGKSEFARAVIQALAGEPIGVPSPTFTLLQSYALPGIEVGHADLYRLADAGEVAELGLEECWRLGALLVEWPERAPALWPEERLEVALAHPPVGPAEARVADLSATGRWAGLLENLAAGLASG
jgi:tRNA threonylcarbamoyl adenosine modification protein YjeE